MQDAEMERWEQMCSVKGKCVAQPHQCVLLTLREGAGVTALPGEPSQGQNTHTHTIDLPCMQDCFFRLMGRRNKMHRF